MIERIKILGFFLLITNLSIAQVDLSKINSDYVYDFDKYYSNGNKKIELHFIDDNGNRILVNNYYRYYRNGNIKDSTFFIKGIAQDARKMFYSDGNIKRIITYSDNSESNDNYFIKSYRKNGDLKFEGNYENNRGMGVHLKYKNGEIIQYKEYHKGKLIFIPFKYLNSKHIRKTPLTKELKYKNAFLTNGEDKIKLKKGSFISCQIEGDSSYYHPAIVEGFSDSSMIISKFNYDLTDNKKKILNFDSTYVINFAHLNKIKYGSTVFGNNYDINTICYVLSMELFVIPTLVGLIIAGPAFIIEPLFVAYYAIGTISYFLGRKFDKQIVPNLYDMKIYSIKIKK